MFLFSTGLSVVFWYGLPFPGGGEVGVVRVSSAPPSIHPIHVYQLTPSGNVLLPCYASMKHWKMHWKCLNNSVKSCKVTVNWKKKEKNEVRGSIGRRHLIHLLSHLFAYLLSCQWQPGCVLWMGLESKRAQPRPWQHWDDLFLSASVSLQPTPFLSSKPRKHRLTHAHISININSPQTNDLSIFIYQQNEATTS